MDTNNELFNKDDVLEEHWHGRTPGTGELRYTHLPTGISVTATLDDVKSVHRTRGAVLTELERLVLAASRDIR